MEFEKPLEAAFRYCPRCATESEEIGEVPFRCHQCGFAFFFGPVGAVGGILRDQAGQILLIRRARDPGAGMLGMPGGFVDRDETAEQALQREIQEEIGLSVERMNFLMTLPNKYTYQGLTAAVLDLFFVCDVPSFDSIQVHPEEVSDVWIGCPGEDQLQEMAFHSNRLALIKYLKDSD